MPTPVLAFFHSRTCGHSRRVDSLVDQFQRTHRGALRGTKVDALERADLAERLGVSTTPTLLLLVNGREVARVEGRCTLPQIRAAFESFIPELPAPGEPAIFAARPSSEPAYA